MRHATANPKLETVDCLDARLIELDLLEQALDSGRDLQSFKLQRLEDLQNRRKKLLKDLPAAEQQRLSRIHDTMIQLTDYLFDKGHTVSKTLMWAAAEWIVGVEDAVYEQGKNAGHAQQFAKDREESVE